MTPNLFLIKPDDVEDLWFGARPLIQKALNHAEGALSTTDVLRMILNGQMHLWVGFQDNKIFTAIVTEFINYPRHKICRIITTATETGHDLDEWYPTMLEHVGEFALNEGCVALEAWCRKGLARQLDGDHEHSVVYKVLKPNTEVL